MSSSLKCNSCTLSTAELPEAMEHVGANLGHVMSVEIDDEGTTLTISLDDDETDDWDEEAL